MGLTAHLGVCHLFKSKNNFQEIFKFYFVFEILNFKKKTSLKMHFCKYMLEKKIDLNY